MTMTTPTSTMSATVNQSAPNIAGGATLVSLVEECQQLLTDPSGKGETRFNQIETLLETLVREGRLSQDEATTLVQQLHQINESSRQLFEAQMSALIDSVASDLTSRYAELVAKLETRLLALEQKRSRGTSFEPVQNQV